MKKKQNKTIKIVVNRCHGGFGLSDEAYKYLIKLGVPSKKYIEAIAETEHWKYNEYVIYTNGKNNSLQGKYWDGFFRDYENRTHKLLIKTVEHLKEKANGQCAELEVVKIPSNVKWEISDYDGAETIEEIHRKW